MDRFVGNAGSSGVIGEERSFNLGVAKVRKRIAGGNSSLSVQVQGREFSFRGGGHHGRDYNTDCVDGAVQRCSTGVADREIGVPAGPRSRLGLRQITSV